MKNILLFFLMIFFALGAYAQEIIQVPSKGKEILKTQDDFSGFHAVFSFDEMRSTTVEDDEFGAFSQIAIDGAFPTGDVGTPALPVFKKMIAVPAGATPKVVVRNFAEQAVDLNERGIHRIFPVQPPVLQGEDEAQQPLVLNETAYSENEFTRSSIVNISVLGTMRGVRIAMLTVQPVRYNPVAEALLVYNDIDVEVIFENGDYAATQSLYQSTYSPYFATPYSYFYNKGVYEDHPDLYKTPVHMLVVADRMFSAALQPWIAWKTKKGFYVEVGYTDEIGTTAAEIQTFCHQKYNAGVSAGKTPTFLVVVGDVEQVPASADGTATGHVTDLYYASVDGDYFPEMYYSRMSAQTPEQLESIISKILIYEQYKFFPGTSIAYDDHFLSRHLLIAGIDGAWNVIYGRQQIRYAYYNYFEELASFPPLAPYVGPYYDDIYDNYIFWSGIVNYAGYCLEDRWNYPRWTAEEVNDFFNESPYSNYSLVIAHCGLSANFGSEESIGEAYNRASAGAVSYLGSAAPAFWNEDFHFTVGAYSTAGDGHLPTPENTTMGFYDAMFREDDFNAIGSYIFAGNLAVTYAAENGYPLHAPENNSALYYWEAYNVLGDASITPYFTQADENEVSHDAKFPMNELRFEVRALPGSMAAVSKDGVLYGAAIADQNGMATIQLDKPVTTYGSVDIVVTKKNYQPYFNTIPAADLSGPYIIYENHKVVGELTLSNATQERDLIISLRNAGSEPILTPWNVTISCDDPQLTIHKNSVQYAPIDVDKTKSGRFNVSVAQDIENGKIFDIHFLVESDRGNWEFTEPLPAYRPLFELETYKVNGIDRGAIVAGTTAVVEAVVKNVGGARAWNAKAQLDNDDPYISIYCSDEEYFFGHIDRGETITATFVVETSPDMPENYLSGLKFMLTAEYGVYFETTFQIDNKEVERPGPTNCTSNHKFNYVRLGEMVNDDALCAPDGYSDFTDKIFTTYYEKEGLKVDAHIIAEREDSYFSLWIDLNGNNIFEKNEIIVDNMMGRFIYEIAYTTLEPATPGYHRARLRIRDKYRTPNPYDGWGDFGQTHDYTAYIPEMHPPARNARAALSENNATLTWDAPNGETPESYTVYKNGALLCKVLDVDERIVVDEYLSGGLYVYSVEAVYMSNNTSDVIYANPVCLNGYQYHCNEPLHVRASIIEGKRQALIEWDEPEDINDIIYGYYVYKNDEIFREVDYGVTEIIDYGLSEGVSVYYLTAVYKNCPESMPSESAEVELIVGVNEMNSVDYQLYPNPATNNITIKGEGLCKIEMYDLQGRKVGEYNNVQEQITITDLSKYAGGLYLVKMYSKNGYSKTKKLVIMNAN